MLHPGRCLPNFPRYTVDEMGRVYSLRRRKYLTPSTCTGGYPKCNLYTDAGVKTVRVHNLVASVFLVRPKVGKYIVDHVDRVRDNNKAGNLRYVTYRQNSQNQTIRKNNKSGVCGVWQTGNRWDACVSINGHKVGRRFKTKGEAIAWRLDMVELHYIAS